MRHTSFGKKTPQVYRLIMDMVKEKNPARRDYGSTPLHMAAANGHLDICQLILQVCSCYQVIPWPLFTHCPPPALGLEVLGLQKESKCLSDPSNHFQNVNSLHCDGECSPHELAAKRGHWDICRLFNSRPIRG